MSDLQRTDEWVQARVGKFTASRFFDVLARNKKTGEPLKAYHDLIMDVVVERLTNEPVESAQGLALMWGANNEPYAKEAFELETGLSVVDSGFILHPKYDFVGCSPDGLIGEYGGCEMKCPKSSRVHLERFEEGVPVEYYAQIQGCMWVTGRKWWKFVSFDPRMPESHMMLIIDVERNDEYIDALEREVLQAEKLVEQKLQSFMRKAA